MPNFVDGFPPDFVEMFADYDLAIRLYNPERYEEVVGIAENYGCNVSMALMINYFFDFHYYCTAVVARQADGSIIGGRIFDFDDYHEKMRRLTYRAVFTRNGTYSHDGVLYAGVSAMGGGMKRGAFNLEMNERMPNATDQNSNFTATAILVFKGYI